MRTNLIVVSGQVRDEADVFGANGLHSGLDGHRGSLLHVLCRARPLGGVIVHQLPHPVCKPDLDVSIERGHWQLLVIKGERSGTVDSRAIDY